MNDQNLVGEHQNRQRRQSNHPRGQKRNGTPSSDPSLIRRHTTPDMSASAAYGMVLCGTDELEHRYRGRIEKVKFGVPVNEAFSPDIPATLLVLLLKVNKEGPLKKDIWRAPGNQAQVRKLSNIMQHGRLVNISNISVYTAASVIKRFLAKLPGGILGAENEKQLFDSVQKEKIGDDGKRELFCSIVESLPIPSQHLLVLLFGTFRVITDSADTFGTRMTPEAIGISVAPSLFHTCIHDGQRAKIEDVLRFKIASQVISEIIRGFSHTNLFPRECYEFYARITGRTLRIDEQWHFTFHLPSRTLSQPSIRFERSKNPELHPTATSAEEEIHETTFDEFCEDEDIFGESLPELAGEHPYARRRDVSKSLDEQRAKASGWREILMQRGRQERLSTSMGEVLVHSEEEGENADCGRKPCGSRDYLESTRSLTYLEWVHERQMRRMQTRSEWFLSPTAPLSKNGAARCEGGRMCYSRLSQRFSASPIHLRLPLKKGTQAREEYTSSGDEEMMCCCSSTNGTGGGACTGSVGMGCGRSGCAAIGSTDTSMKCSPRRPDSCCTTSGCGSAGDAQMKSQTGTEEGGETSDDDAFLADTTIEHQHTFHPPFLMQNPHSPTAKMVLGRQPFQLLQERQYSTSTTDGSASAQVTPSAVELCASGKSVGNGGGRQRFFGSGEQEGGLQALPELSETTTVSPLPRRFSAPYVDISDEEQNRTKIPPALETQFTEGNILTRQKHQQKGAKLIQTMSSGSSGSGSGGSGASAQTVIGVVVGGAELSDISKQQQTRLIGTGVVRRRSWRTHYTRPKNKSLDSETAVGVELDIRKEGGPSSHSIPLRCSSPLVFSRRHSSNGDSHKKGAVENIPSSAPSSAREALIRRKSSSNNNDKKSKPPVQTRRSTQI